MEKRCLLFDVGTVRQLQDGSYEVIPLEGRALRFLATDMAALVQWVQSPDPASPDLQPDQRAVFRSSATVYTHIAGCEGWEYQEYGGGVRKYSTVVLYYRDSIITILKRWSKHFSEEDNAKIHYATLAQAVQAHRHSEKVQWADRRAKQKASPDSLATAAG